MQDAYSFARNQRELDQDYQTMGNAYKRIFQRLNLPVVKVKASSGIMGGGFSEEFMLPSEIGEDKIVVCSSCDYKASLECASSIPPQPQTISRFKKLAEVKTPRMTTVSQIADFLKISPASIIKSLVYSDPRTNELVLVLIRGDLEINQSKLQTVLGHPVKIALAKECQQQGILPGFVGPQVKNIPVIADFSLKIGQSFVAGANKIDTHLVGLTLKDFKVDQWADLAEVRKGDFCSKCGKKILIKKSIELAHIFKLGTQYSESMAIYFTDKNNKRKPILMGCYGMGLERVMAAIVEAHHDQNGIIWPKSIAPFFVYLMDITTTSRKKKLVEKIYKKLEAAGIEVLYDDREKTAGYKFAEADLIGCPVRLTISSRSLAKNCIELEERSIKKPKMVPINKIVQILRSVDN